MDRKVWRSATPEQREYWLSIGYSKPDRLPTWAFNTIAFVVVFASLGLGAFVAVQADTNEWGSIFIVLAITFGLPSVIFLAFDRWLR